uniref:Uncharacterized protein n=1 Tax=Equus caballus TaxID=9796 RepID=A0A3Q2II36_HORSE
IQSKIFPRAFLQIRAGRAFMFTACICCNAKHIWQAVNHQESSYDSRSQEVSIELAGLLHVKNRIL